MTRPSPAVVAVTVLLMALAAAPLLAAATAQPFVLFLLTRLMILAIAATGLNLVLGIGGMPSFGHAALVGVGAYAAAIVALQTGGGAWTQTFWAVAAATLAAFAMGAISLRTRGIAFILVTLALGQMLFFFAAALEPLGGDDGINVPATFAGDAGFYYAVFALLAAATAATAWVRATPFGMALRGGAVNEDRIAAAGIDLPRVRLLAFAASGAVCGLAGALTTFHTAFVSPAAMGWSRSAELVAMVLVGGAGAVAGPLFGTAAFVALEELLSGYTTRWHLVFGPVLVIVVLAARGGIAGWIDGRTRD
ncbi:MAG: branched-chain amino acid ABC transporter permease [Proteobacteria bacterium]|nr:branched-chain amino acid ABC transporter permease [Pseudomonadota bacterium]MDA1132855.1 branched-chain amino acid ABC transporter permease [Pseudomonadota bacterium]